MPRPSRKIAIMQAAARLFAIKGYTAVSVRDIAAEMELTPASLYYYFPDKETLYRQTLVMVFTGSPIHITVFEALYPLVTLFFFSLGVGLFLAAATVFFRDIMHIWSVFITALLYFSAIFYDPTQMTFSIGGFNMQQIIKLNPMYWYITGFRRTLMWGIPLDINMFLVCGLCALISMLIGVQMFRKTQDRFVLHI